MENLFSKAPLALFCTLFVKVAVLGSSAMDAAILAVTAILIIALEFKIERNEIKELTATLKATQTQIDDMKKETNDIRAFINGQRMGQLRTSK